ncbi:MAG: M15 family metallopeptidase [Methylobacter sp.]|uniref:M15 family metallopeptidase n=1 Tax=Methylobacter sp. TaxID=2051955 RepID=UPI0025D49B96|nr:M15 family metallopeptidase [Methylobacter sp.]MCK9621986.1 M15 family metallopeptidase [Methylobacter sp.]
MDIFNFKYFYIMITSKQCQERYGAPELERAMVIFDVPAQLEIGFIPKRIYCNKDLVKPLEKALNLIVLRDCAKFIKSWDGCFNIRKKRGLSSKSLHSWGLAIDINAASNQLGHYPTLNPELVKCFKEAGFDWGGDWARPDGMHMQLSSFK